MKTVRYHDDGLDIGRLVREGSSGWAGPSPLAHQSRWAAVEQHRRQQGRALKLITAGASFTALVFVLVMLAATVVSPNGSAIVMNLMSHVFTGGTMPSPSAVPSSSGSANPAAPQPAGAPSGSPRPRPTSASWSERPETAPPSPGPYPSRGPTPRPSESPDT